MTSINTAELLNYLTLACVFVGMFMLITGVFHFARRGENHAEARNRRMRMVRQGVTDEDRLALLLPETQTGFFAKIPFFGNLPDTLVQAGLHVSAKNFVLLCLFGTLAIATVGMMFLPPWQAAPIALIIGVLMPALVVKSRQTERQKALTSQLPDALELMARGLKIGHPVNTSIKAVADEMQDPIGTEFGIIFDQISFGDELPDAVQDFADRVGSEDAQYLAASMAIQHGTGGDLERIVSVLAAVVRRRIALRARIKAISAEGRLSGFLLSIIPLVIMGVMSINAPGYYTDISDDPAFIKLAVLVVVLMVSNVIILHKLVNFRI
ncbi:MULTISPECIES: type II secretion system F family protein [unclassified Ruegeria]|uniref:type II secretion system F family protein n=1 Tax=unclassified Ruegeria TaxID=2625375 RepID=UPI001489CB0F|nr:MULTISPECIES: type II secretion system F family protein [unclassified Ruegeria]